MVDGTAGVRVDGGNTKKTGDGAGRGACGVSGGVHSYIGSSWDFGCWDGSDC